MSTHEIIICRTYEFFLGETFSIKNFSNDYSISTPGDERERPNITLRTTYTRPTFLRQEKESSMLLKTLPDMPLLLKHWILVY